MSTFQAVILEARAHRNLREQIAEALKDRNLTVMEWALLGLVSEHQEDGISVSELARVLDVKTALTSVMVTKQVNAGWLEKIPSEVDNRLRYVRLTSRGKTQVAEIETMLHKKLGTLLGEVSTDDMDVYYKVMQHLSESL